MTHIFIEKVFKTMLIKSFISTIIAFALLFTVISKTTFLRPCRQVFLSTKLFYARYTQLNVFNFCGITEIIGNLKKKLYKRKKYYFKISREFLY